MYILQNVTITLFQIIFVTAAYAKTNVISCACEAAYSNALTILAVATLRGGNELHLLIYAVRVCRLPSLFSIMFPDTLYSKKWYDMPHIGCGIHSLQRSTISRCADISPPDMSPPDNRPQDIRPPDISPPMLICMI